MPNARTQAQRPRLRATLRRDSSHLLVGGQPSSEPWASASTRRHVTFPTGLGITTSIQATTSSSTGNVSVYPALQGSTEYSDIGDVTTGPVPVTRQWGRTRLARLRREAGLRLVATPPTERTPAEIAETSEENAPFRALQARSRAASQDYDD